MLFNSLDFMFFFPVVLLVYYIIPVKTKCIWLLISSFYFYMSWNPEYIILLGTTILTTWVGGIVIDNIGEDKSKKTIVLTATIGINIVLLAYFKYTGFILNIMNRLFRVIGKGIYLSSPSIILPVGISFFTFQTIGYLIDVYRGEIKGEKNILRYALFVSFFPQLVAGPIERSKNLMKQIEKCTTESGLVWKEIYCGGLYMLWGFFLKIVIADRIAVIVQQVFDQYYLYGTMELALGTVAFALQIYCDFAGYSIIAIGAAKMLGFTLMENFDTPYFSIGLKDFWRRWHLSLSMWFRDYVYIPLGGSRKGRTRKYLNVMLTMILSGLWHGAGLTFVIWGFLHGIFQIAEDWLSNVLKKRRATSSVNCNCFSYRAGRILWTFLLVNIAWVFFRAPNVHVAVDYIIRLFSKWDPWVLSDGSLTQFCGGTAELNILVISLGIMFAVDMIRYRKKMAISDWLVTQDVFFQGLWVLALFFFIIIFGAYGEAFNPQTFIYFQF